VPWTVEGVRAACAALTTINLVLMRAVQAETGKRVPPLYATGVRYQRQRGPERFLPWPLVLRRRTGDCDQLAAWRSAELQLQGIRARAVPYFAGPRTMHVIVIYPDGRREDPSKLLGMKGAA
jgi:hypothetical protein